MKMAKSVLELIRLARFWIGGSTTSAEAEASGKFLEQCLDGAEY